MRVPKGTGVEGKEEMKLQDAGNYAMQVRAEKYQSGGLQSPLVTEGIGGAPQVRLFSTGATRDLDENKYDYEGFLSPRVLRRFGAYMHKHRMQPDGQLRDSDNWQKGIPPDAYMKSLLRHVMDVWTRHRGVETEESIEEALCAVIFNAQGYLHTRLLEMEYATTKSCT